ncbi:MAG: hypothetical protein KKF77_04960 [Proteobacteria bacterium]|nr:hypothetical protein [Pseudomonadota bacterium]
MKGANVFLSLMAAVGLTGLLMTTPALANTSTDEALGRIERVLDDVEQIQRIMRDRPSEVERERERLHRAELQLERERVHAMSIAAGISRHRVERMRARGMSWGRIAHELRVSPFVVGIATGHYGERDYRRGHDHDDDERFEKWHGANHGKKKGWKNGMPPGQAKKHDRD